jgi:hypothetical protein
LPNFTLGAHTTADNHHLPAILDRRRLRGDAPNREETQQRLHRPILDLRLPSGVEAASARVRTPHDDASRKVCDTSGRHHRQLRPSRSKSQRCTSTATQIGHPRSTTKRVEARRPPSFAEANSTPLGRAPQSCTEPPPEHAKPQPEVQHQNPHHQPVRTAVLTGRFKPTSPPSKTAAALMPGSPASPHLVLVYLFCKTCS